ncbi:MULTISPECIES: hypothetical protein [unclassified Agromyces]|uniref:hypothetical protein n=1 Tax=unclassified Agromyces TaxID=2639701 RepID=UPI00301428FF
MTLRRLSPALVAPAIAALLLAGCSAGPAANEAESSSSPSESASESASGQTEAEACAAMVGGLENLAGLDPNQLMDDMTNDPDAAIATLDEAESAIVAATDEVTNAELEPIAQEAAAATTSYFDLIRDAAADPASADVTAIQTGLTTFTEAFMEVQEACTA